MIKKLLATIKRKGIYIGWTKKFKAPKKTWKQKQDK